MKKYFFIFIVAFFASCSPVEQDVIITIDTETVLNDCYIGNGAQWDPYQLDYGKGKLTISEADWEKLYDRLDFMRPQFIRIMINTSSFVDQGRLVPERGMEVLSKMLDYCQSRNVTVMFGDWGWSVIRAREAEIDSQSLRHAAALVDYLVHNKGYSCIRYYNLVNGGCVKTLTQPFFMRKAQTFSSPGFVITQSFRIFRYKVFRYGKVTFSSLHSQPNRSFSTKN